jgi:phage major head subunit gpT-like protein
MTIRRLTASDISSRPMRLVGAASLDPVEGDGKGLRKFHMAAYNGGTYKFPWSAAPVVLDLAGLLISDKPRPILKDHDTAQVVGHSTAITNDTKALAVDGVVSGTGPAASEVVANSDNGFPWQASIGADILSVEDIAHGVEVAINGQTFTGPLCIVRASRLSEVSFVALGADDSTTAAMTAALSTSPVQEPPTMNFDDWLKSLGLDPATLTPEAVAALQKAYDAEKSAADAEASKAADAPEKAKAARAAMAVAIKAAHKPAVVAKPAQADHLQAQREKAAADVERVAALHAIAAGHPKILAQAIREGWAAEKTELEVLRASRAQAPAIHSGSLSGVTDLILQAAVCLSGRHSEAESLFDEKTLEAAAKKFRRGIGLQEMLLEAAYANGYQGRSFRQDPQGVLRAAFALQASGGFSTVDMPGILSNVSNKFLLEGYSSVEQAWKKIAAIRSVNDFKTATSYRMTGDDQYEIVGPTGSIKHGTATEQAFTNKADTYAKLLGISRTDMINDDLSAITAAPRKLGRGAGTKLNDVFWTEFMNNSAFFTSGNKNLITGATTALSIDALSSLEQLFLDQTDTEGRPLGVSPAVLLLPTALSAFGNAIARSLEVRDTTANTKAPTMNPHAGKFEPVVSAYLGNTKYVGNSVKAFFLLANPADLAAIEVAFLNGQESPTIETADADFNTLGIQMRGYHDFGVAKQDFRAAAKSKGEA